MLRFIVANTGAGKTSYVCARFGIERMHGDPARKDIKKARCVPDVNLRHQPSLPVKMTQAAPHFLITISHLRFVVN